MNKFHAIIILGLLSASAEGSSYYELKSEPYLEYKTGKLYTSNLIDYPLNIDGFFLEDCWADFDNILSSEFIIDDFIQEEPNNLSSATFKTKVKIVHDNEYIYVAAKLFDPNPLEINSQMSRRDEWDLMSSDSFLIEFDSMHDHQTSYFFGLNSSGIQMDGVSYLDFDDDLEYNAIWESAVSIVDDGWNLEMKIPFKMLSITQIENPWGMNIHRNIPRLHEYNSWVAFPRDISGIASHFGHIFGFKEINIASALEIKPYFLIGSNHNKDILLKDDQLYQNIFENSIKDNEHNNLGVDFKYRLSKSSSVDISIKPDFGQVEMDPEYINLSYYEIYLPEKRIFFNEIETVFNTPIELFYSRRIGASDNTNHRINSAYKIKGHSLSGADYGFLAANTCADSLGFSLWNNTGKEFYAFRMAKDFNITTIPSYFGITALRFSDNKETSIISFDNTSYLFNNNLIIDYQYVKDESDNSEEFGYYFNASYYSKFPIFFNFNSEYYSKNLDLNQMGFLLRNNIRSFDYNLGFKTHVQTLSIFRKFKIDIYRSIHHNLAGLKIKDNLGTQFNFHLLNYSRIIMGYFFEEEHFDDYYMYDFEEELNGPAFLLPQINRFYLKFDTDDRSKYILNLGLEFDQSSNNDNLIDGRINLISKVSSNQIIKFYYGYTIFNNSYDFLESVINDINPSNQDSSEYIFSNTNGWEKRYGVRIEKYFSNKASLQLYTEYFQHSNKFGDYTLWDSENRWPGSNPFIDGGSTPDGNFIPLYTDGATSPEIIEEDDGSIIINQYLNPNYYVGFYPRYTSLNLNLSFKYEYKPGSEFYIVYTVSKSVNGILFDNIKDFITHTKKVNWTEQYSSRSLYIKFNYWFDL